MDDHCHALPAKKGSDGQTVVVTGCDIANRHSLAVENNIVIRVIEVFLLRISCVSCRDLTSLTRWKT